MKRADAHSHEAMHEGPGTPKPRQMALSETAEAAERPDESMDSSTLKPDLASLGSVSVSMTKWQKAAQRKSERGHGT